jgi:hypothetical protein
MDARARSVLVFVVVLLVVAVPLFVLFVSGGDDESPGEAATGLRVERSVDLPELLVYVEQDVNTPARAGGRRTVTLRCDDSDGELVARQEEAWPFADTDQGTLAPHAHVPMDGPALDAVARCRLEGTEPQLDAPVL